jgi:hypothetical protein
VTALREVFARFGVKFDSTELNKGDKATKGVVERLRELGGVLAGGAVVQGLRTFVSQSAEIGDEIARTARVMGLGTEELQRYRLAAQQAGVGSDQLNDALKTLQQTSTDAAQGGGMRAVFDQIGLSATDAEGRVKPISVLLPEIAANIGRLGTPSERAAFLMRTMGESAGRLGPLFENGAEGMALALAQLDELGGGASEDFIAASERMTDAYVAQDAAILSLRARIGVLLLPIIERLVTGVTKLLAAFTKATEGTHVLELAMTALGVAATIAGAKVVASFARLLLTFGAVTAGATLLILVIDDLWTHFEGGQSVLGSTVESFLEWVSATTEGAENTTTVLGNLAFAWNQIVDAMTAVINLGTRATNALGLTDVLVNESASLIDPLAVGYDGTAKAPAAGPSLQDRYRAAMSARGFAPDEPVVAQGSPARRRGGGAVVNSAPTVNIAISGQGLDERQVAEAAARAARREIDAANRDALEDLEGLTE